MTYKLGPFLGINHKRADFDLRVRTNSVQGDYLRDALNVDIDNGGNLRRRLAPSLVQVLSGAHSLHLLDGGSGLLVRDAVLYRVTLPAYSEVLVKTLSSDARMSYQAAGDSLYFSNGTDSGRVLGSTAYPWALPRPAAPGLSSVGGSLPAGLYQVVVSYYNSGTGEEGGVSPSAQVVVVADSGVRVSLPGATTGATHVRVYLSGTNGAVPQLAATVAPGGVADILTVPSGADAPTRREMPLPAGELLLSSGRLCSFSGNTLYLGHPHKFGYCDPLASFIPFPAPISVAVDAQTGIFVAADKTYWVPNDGQVVDVFPYGAVSGTAFSLPDKAVYGWFGAKGLVLASPSGEAQTLMDSVEVTPPVSGMTALITDGFDRAVSCGWCVNLDTKAVTRYEGWDFTSFSSGYGTRDDGIYALDSSDTVAWSADFGKVDLGDNQEKHLPNAYLGVQSSDIMLLNVQAPGKFGGDYTYPTRGYSAELNVQRIDVGKGLRANWFNLALSGETGSDFILADIEFVAATTKRRI